MKIIGTFVLALAVFAIALAEPQDVRLNGGPSDEGFGLEILDAQAQTTLTPATGRGRVFTIVVKNTGTGVIKSAGFTFAVIDAERQTIQKIQKQDACGFMITGLDIQPNDSVTIKRELSGNHCIPEDSVDQVVRVQEIEFSDGSNSRRIEDSLGWSEVKLLPVKTTEQ